MSIAFRFSWLSWPLLLLSGCGPAPDAGEEQRSAQAAGGGASRDGGGATDGATAPMESAEVDEGPVRAGLHPDDPEGWEPIQEFLGRPVEVVRVLRADGRLERITTHLQGQRGPGSHHGPEWLQFPNGVSKLRQVWVEGVLDGPFSSYWNIGLIRTEGVYRQGQRHGSFYQYHRNGDRQHHYEYVDGVPEGTWREWYVGNILGLEETYVAGRKQGPFRKWARPETGDDGEPLLDAEPVLEREAIYVDNLENGLLTDYWPSSGSVRRKGLMEDGQMVGTWILNFEDGSLKAERNFVAGQLEGLETVYDEAGSRIAENNYVAGSREGVQRNWYPNGQLQREGKMVGGLAEGYWSYFNPDGSPNDAWSGTYKAGHLIDE